jgi:pilus assembly protein Flp/PilA
MSKLASAARKFLRDEEGASLVEYVLLVALIGVAAIAAMQYVNTKASGSLNNAANKL